MVEVDGEVHQGQIDYDAERDRVLSKHGLSIIRITIEEVRGDLYRVMARIVHACRKGIA